MLYDMDQTTFILLKNKVKNNYFVTMMIKKVIQNNIGIIVAYDSIKKTFCVICPNIGTQDNKIANNYQ